MASLKENVVFSTILAVSGYVFPLITFPYVSRVLGVSNIGICDFVDSIIQYFIVFSMMGITTIGIREISRTRNDRKKLSSVFNSLLTLNVLTATISVVALLFAVSFVPKLQNYSNLFYIGAAKIIANAISVEWLYRGLENFKYITSRTIAVKLLYVASVFVFVRESDDYDVYFLLTVLTLLVNSFINIFHGRKYVDFFSCKPDFKPYLRPFFVLGVYFILTSMYTTFNTSYLGFKLDAMAVGLYSSALKLFSIIMSFYTAFTGVMLPRMSSLVSEENWDGFERLVSKSFDALYVFVFPIIVICEVCSPQIIFIMAGNGYEGAVLPMRIITPLMLVIGIEQILVLQMLTPMRKDSAILINSAIGAIVGISSNIFLVPLFGESGTATAWGLSEIAVLVSSALFVKKYMGFKFPMAGILKRMFLYAPALCVLLAVSHLVGHVVLSLVFVSLIAVAIVFIIEFFVMKNQLLVESKWLKV